MGERGKITGYFARGGLTGLLLHGYAAWQLSVFAMPRENLHWNHIYDIPPIVVYTASDILTPKFLEPPNGHFRDSYKSYLDSKLPAAAPLPSSTYLARVEARTKTLEDKVDAVPEWINNRGNPATLLYAIGACTLAYFASNRHCINRVKNK